MQYFVTIYIDPIFELEGFTHAFLGLTHMHPDELDKIDSEIKMQKLNNADWKDFDKKWYEKIYPTINPYVLGYDSSNDEGFFGFGTATTPIKMLKDKFFSDGNAGKVFENNQYIVSPDSKTNSYVDWKIRSKETFSNRCVLEISQEQYQTLFQSIQNDVYETSFVGSQGEIKNEKFIYDITNNNCVTWVLNKLDSIGIEIIDNEEWLPDNISTRDSLLQKFHYLQYLYAVFRKFQSIDSNLESIAGAKAFRTWARSMTQNKIFCALKIEGDITKGLNISTECKRTITQNQKYYENKLKDFITKSSDFMRVYNRINEQLERLLTKVKNLGYTNIQGDFTFIMWNDELQTRMLLDSKHRDENTKDYIAYPIEQIDPNIPACNWTLNHNASFILILRDEMLCRAVYKNYHYSNMSESFIDSINKSHIAILSGNDDLSYWSKSLHALRKSVVYEEGI